MSIAEKQMFIKHVSERLVYSLSLNQLKDVEAILKEVAAEYDFTRIAPASASGNSGDMIQAFLAAKEIEGRSQKTLTRYDYIINRMLKAVNAPVESVNVYHIRNYLMSEKQRGICDNTIEGYRNVFSSLFGWLHKEGLISSNPVVNIGPIKCEKKVRFPLSDIDIEKLNEACNTDRNKAIFYFLLSTGCRISEACGLNRDDVNLQTLECTVLGKGNKQRTVFISNVAAMMLERYFENRTDDSPALFAGKGSERLTPGGVRFMLKQVADRAGVENVHPHRFRRTLATNLINRGMQIQDVAFILGHDKLDTTLKYVYIAQENVKNSYRKYA